MYPFLLPEVFGYALPMYDLLILLGVFLMLIYVGNRLEKENGYTRQESNRLLVLIIVSLLIALFSSWVFGGIFHSIQEGEISFGPITFLGGLIGGVVSFLILLKYFFKNEKLQVKPLMNTIITGVVLAHAFGRIGCFFAGCCYGIPTESFLGVMFPHGHAHDIYPGEEVLPTQLFEAAFCFALFIGLNKIQKFKGYEVEAYVIGYGIWRFLLEFIRGDERGALIPLFSTQYNTYPTPSQFISLGLIVLGFVILSKYKKQEMIHE